MVCRFGISVKFQVWGCWRNWFLWILDGVYDFWWLLNEKSCLKAFEQCLNLFKQCLNLFKQCLNTFQSCLKAFEQCLNTFQLCFYTFQSCLKVFKQSLNTLQSCLKAFEQCLNTLQSEPHLLFPLLYLQKYGSNLPCIEPSQWRLLWKVSRDHGNSLVNSVARIS